MRQRLPYGSNADNRACTYEITEKDWKPDEGYAYDNDRSLNIVVKVVINIHLSLSLLTVNGADSM